MLHVVGLDANQLGRSPATPLVAPLPLETMAPGILWRDHQSITEVDARTRLKLHLGYPHLGLLLDLVLENRVLSEIDGVDDLSQLLFESSRPLLAVNELLDEVL